VNDAAFNTALAEVENQYVRARVANQSLARLLREVIEAVEDDSLTEYKKHRLRETKALLEDILNEEPE
jgi:hypothetical protein